MAQGGMMSTCLTDEMMRSYDLLTPIALAW